jgi:hypothetical protein
MSIVESDVREYIGVLCGNMHVLVDMYSDSICQSNTEAGFKEGQL